MERRSSHREVPRRRLQEHEDDRDSAKTRSQQGSTLPVLRQQRGTLARRTKRRPVQKIKHIQQHDQETAPRTVIKKIFDKMIHSTTQIDKLGIDIATLALHNPDLMKGVRDFYLEEVNIVQGFFDQLKKEGVIKQDTDTRVIAVSILSFRSGLRGFLGTEEKQETIYHAWKLQTELLLREIMV